MPIFEKNKERILFVHIPKTGGTSITELFRRAGWKITMNKKGSQHHVKDVWESWGEFSWIFSIVRHPVHRMLSDARGRNIHPYEVNKTINDWLYEPYVKHGNHNRPQVDFIDNSCDATIYHYVDKKYIPELLEITGQSEYPHLKGDTYNPNVNLTCLCENTIEVIQNHFKQDMEEFNFTRM